MWTGGHLRCAVPVYSIAGVLEIFLEGSICIQYCMLDIVPSREHGILVLVCQLSRVNCRRAMHDH